LNKTRVRQGGPNFLIIVYHLRSIKIFTYHLIVSLSNCLPPKHPSWLKSTKQMLQIRFLHTTYRLFAYLYWFAYHRLGTAELDDDGERVQHVVDKGQPFAARHACVGQQLPGIIFHKNRENEKEAMV
jgi:hypothetical protein